MAYQNKVIINPAAGLRIKFLQTASDTKEKVLELEASYDPGSKSLRNITIPHRKKSSRS